MQWIEIILENMEIERQKLIVKMLIWGYKKIEIRNQLVSLTIGAERT